MSLLRPLAVLVLLACFSVPALAQSLGAAGEAEAYLQRHASDFGLRAADVADLVVTDAYASRRSGTTHVYLRQRLRGVPVVGSEFTVAINRSGRVFHAAGEGTSLGGRRDLSATPTMTAGDAAAALAREVGLQPATSFQVLAREGGAVPTVTLSDAGLAQKPVKAKLVYHLDENGEIALAWEVELEERAAPHYWLGYVDASSGEVRERIDLVIHDSFGPAHADHEEGPDLSDGPVAVPTRAAVSASTPASAPPTLAPKLAGSYTVYAMPLESPLWAATAPPGDARTVVSDPEDATASPFGWHDTDGAAGAEFTTTRGNNVEAYADVDGNNAPDAGSSPDGGAGLVFDFPIDLTQDPSTYKPAAVTNLFYWSNITHDVMYRYGFDEAAGNFQVNNYGRGGVGGDDVRAEAQDASVSGGGNCNANFATPPDGSRPRMQMYTCDAASPDVDGDFDNGVIVHEYGHGISTRLTGGPSNSGCLSGSEQMGEGWSDYYAIMFTMDGTDTRTTSRPMGNYLIGQSQSGGGIRPAPYNTSFAVNGFTYGDTNGGGLSVPHGIGFVWATILWEMTWDLIDVYGFDPDLYDAEGTAGNQIAMNLVTEAMKLQPCNPGFVDGRDAILAADAALYPDPAAPGQGLHYGTLWQAFARRGLGASASQGSSSSNADNVEAFDTPLPSPSAAHTPSSVDVTLAPSEATSVVVTLSNTASPGSSDLDWVAGIQNATVPAGAVVPARPGVALAGSEKRPAEQKGEDRFAGTGSVNLTGGPDAFGYTFTDSDEPGGPAVDFQDISGTGTPIAWTPASTFPGGDEGYADVALPFAFPFYGTSRSSVRVFSNGFLTFSSFAANSFTNGALPASATPNAVIAPFWDDLDQSASGEVYTGVLPDGRFVVQYDGVVRYNTTAPVTFQVLLSANGAIEVQYGAMNGVLNSATVGIENDAGNVGLPVVVDAAYVASNKAVRLTPPATWVTVAPGSGTIAPAADGTLDVAFDASDLPEGIYTADLVIATNDPENAAITIPIELDVSSTSTTTVSVAVEAGWNLLSVPLATTDMSPVALFPDAASDFFAFDDGYVAAPVLENGQGYWAKFDAPASRTITGTVVVPQDVPVAAGWNLVGFFEAPVAVSDVDSEPSGLVASSFFAFDDGYTAASMLEAGTAYWVKASGPGVLQAAAARPYGRLTARSDAAPRATNDASISAEGAAEAARLTVTDADGHEAVLLFLPEVPSAEVAASFVLPPVPPAEVFDARLLPAPVREEVHPQSRSGRRDGRSAAALAEGTWSVALSGATYPVTLSLEGLGVGRFLVRDGLDGSVLSAVLADGGRVDVEASLPVVTLRHERPDVTPLAGGASAVVPTDFALAPIYPNPSTGAATIAFSVPEATDVRIAVYDVLGRAVAVLVEGPVRAGRHEAALAAGLPTGTYLVRMTTEQGFARTQRLTLLR